MPDLKRIEDRILPFLDDKPASPYEVCAATGLSFSQMLVDLKILEVAGKVKRVPGRGRKTLWMLASAPVPAPVVEAPKPEAPKKSKGEKAKKDLPVVEVGEVAV